MKLPLIDRSNDVPPPSDRTSTQPCPKCGKQMIGRIEAANGNRWPRRLRWFWWCGGCGHIELGGEWHPATDDENALARWRRANGEA